jgi:polyisoprenoid-binding protein YceI
MIRTTIKAITPALLLLPLAACEPVRSADARTVDVVQKAASSSSTTRPVAASIRYVTASAGNMARYRIREQLVGLDLPNDAVGETAGVTGVIAADARGNIIAAESKFTVNVSTLKSDRDRRDNFVRRRVLETEQHPNVTFVPKSVRGITLPLPKAGTRSFEIHGDLTVRGTTRPTVWKVTAQFQADRVTGAAATSFTFSDFGIEQPRVPVVLSVDETIKLELDFTLIPDPAKR